MRQHELIEGVYDVNLEIDADAYEARQELVIRATAYPIYWTGKYRESDTVSPSLFSFTVDIPPTEAFLQDVMQNQDETWIDSDGEGVPAWLVEQIKRAEREATEPMEVPC